jgi:hypothetical protein
MQSAKREEIAGQCQHPGVQVEYLLTKAEADVGGHLIVP